jgi:FAD/FMN-containing dehydrogenase
VTDSITPTDFDAAAAALAAAAAARRSVRITGGATKLHWGAAGDADALELRSVGLNRTLEHNVGDLTAIFEAGVPLAQAQAQLAQHGQMLAVDPPLGSEGASGATLGGVFATADSGPLRHRYGQPRDLIVGITVALSDGTIAKAGGKVIKNVAGYDLAKLFTGSFGTLGMILSVSVRLHPLPQATATVLGESGDPGVLSAAAVQIAREPLELDALDVAWRSGPPACALRRRAVAVTGRRRGGADAHRGAHRRGGRGRRHGDLGTSARRAAKHQRRDRQSGSPADGSAGRDRGRRGRWRRHGRAGTRHELRRASPRADRRAPHGTAGTSGRDRARWTAVRTRHARHVGRR